MPVPALAFVVSLRSASPGVEITAGLKSSTVEIAAVNLDNLFAIQSLDRLGIL
jgi:hypothetical protein